MSPAGAIATRSASHSSNDAGLSGRLRFHGIDSAVSAVLKKHRDMVLEELPGVLDGFYRMIAEVPETAAFFRSRDHMNHAKAMQVKHWASSSRDVSTRPMRPPSPASARSTTSSAFEPRWYIGGYNALVTGVLAAIEKRMPVSLMDRSRTAERKALQVAVTKAAMLDMDIAIAVYIEAGRPRPPRDVGQARQRLRGHGRRHRHVVASKSGRCRAPPAAHQSASETAASPASSPRPRRTPRAMSRRSPPRRKSSAPPSPRSASR